MMHATKKSTRQTKYRDWPKKVSGNSGKFVILESSLVKAEAEPHWEPCARCRRYYRLIPVGRLWLQPLHDCLMAEEEQMRT